MEIFLILILIFIILRQEGVIETFKPDETNYPVCSNNGQGNDYNENQNVIETPLTGFYSSIIDLTGERKPILPVQCNTKQPHHHYFNTNTLIDQKLNTWKPQKNPYTPYTDPLSNYSIMYSGQISDSLLNQKKNIQKEDNRFNVIWL